MNEIGEKYRDFSSFSWSPGSRIFYKNPSAGIPNIYGKIQGICDPRDRDFFRGKEYPDKKLFLKPLSDKTSDSIISTKYFRT